MLQYLPDWTCVKVHNKQLKWMPPIQGPHCETASSCEVLPSLATFCCFVQQCNNRASTATCEQWPSLANVIHNYTVLFHRKPDRYEDQKHKHHHTCGTRLVVALFPQNRNCESHFLKRDWFIYFISTANASNGNWQAFRNGNEPSAKQDQ